MKVLVDTCVWSLALRRHKQKATDDPHVLELQELIKELRVQMIGPIRQEILSGLRSPAQFKVLRDRLRTFPDLELTGTIMSGLRNFSISSARRASRARTLTF